MAPPKKSPCADCSRELGVGDIARRSGVAVSAIHFYETKGLLYSWRNSANQRRYPREALRRVSLIKVAQRLGIPLGAIKAALDALPRGRTPTESDWRKLSARWRADLDRRITQLTQVRDRLSECIGCGCLSLQTCPLRNPGDTLGQKGPGPRLIEPGEAG